MNGQDTVNDNLETDSFERAVGVVIVVFSLAIVISLTIAAVHFINEVQCDKKWSQFQHRYSFAAGCQVYKPDSDILYGDGGKWVPAENYQILDK